MATGVARTLEVLDAARLALAALAGAVVLLYVGAKLEREIMKRRLHVVDGADQVADVRAEEAGGRS